MQDVRIRTGAAVLLSCAAFSGIVGAGATIIWLLFFSHPREMLKRIHRIFPLLIVITFFAIVMGLTGGEGILYGARMMVIVLVGLWLYSEYHTGDFLHLGTWLLGEGTGFELGMLAEMGLQSLDILVSDLARIRQAQDLKGLRWGIRSLVPAGTVLLHGALSRADETAELMAVRGYTRGGTLCPEFITPKSDIVAGLMALCVAIIVFIPVSEFFILYR